MSGKAIRETLGFLGVMTGLVFVGIEIQQNTRVLRREAALARAASLTEPYLGDSPLPAILELIKSVDGFDPQTSPFMEQYDLSYQQALIWTRHLFQLWFGLEADYMLEGVSPGVENRVALLLGAPDNQLFWEVIDPLVFSSPQFVAYVGGVRDPI